MKDLDWCCLRVGKVAWYNVEDKLPKNNTRVLVDVGGYTQSVILFYKNGVWYDDIKSNDLDYVEYEISHLISRWCYLPLSRKDQF